MLSQHDRDALAGIEQRLRETDPEFAQRLERTLARRPRHLRVLWLPVAAGLITGAVLLALAIVGHSADMAVAAVLALVAAATGAVLGAVSAAKSRP